MTPRAALALTARWHLPDLQVEISIPHGCHCSAMGSRKWDTFYGRLKSGA